MFDNLCSYLYAPSPLAVRPFVGLPNEVCLNQVMVYLAGWIRIHYFVLNLVNLVDPTLALLVVVVYLC